MNRLLRALAALLMVALAAAPALAAPVIEGGLWPVDDGHGSFYDAWVNPDPIDAQTGTDVLIKGSVAPVGRANYWVQIGLVPRSVYNEFQAGTRTSLWNEGVYVLIQWDSSSSRFLYAAEDCEGQAGVPARYTGKRKVSIQLRLKPRLGRTGGTATLLVGGLETNLGKKELSYGQPDAASARTEDYSDACFVFQVLSDEAFGETEVWLTAKQTPDAVRVIKTLTYDASLTERDTFSPGEPVTVQTRYKVLSTRTNRLQYDVRGEVKLLGTTQGVSENRRTGKYGFNKSFLIPAKTNPGTYRVQVKLQLVRHLTDHYTNEPYEELLYTEEVFDKITVQ